MFSGISGSSSLYNMGWFNMAQMNDLKLSLLSNKYSSFSSTPSVSRLASQKLSDEEKTFLNDYQSKMSSLLSAANALDGTNPGNVMDTMGIQSSDASVLTADAKYRLNSADRYTVDVQQLAAVQVNHSEALDAGGPPVAGGSFELSTATGTYRFDVDTSEAKDNREVLGAVADEINRLKTGVSAQVVMDKGQAVLALSGGKTGEDNGFSVTGGFAERIGLDKVAQASKDAVYSVSKNGGRATEFTSADNKVTIGGYQIEATLKGEGKTELTVGPDADKTADAMQKLVDSFNSAYKFLDSNSERSVGVLKQMKSMISPPTSIRSMKLAGISINADGTMAFDKSTFKAAMGRDPSLIKDIVGGSHGMAQGIARDAKNALDVSSNSLLGKSAASAASSTARQQSLFDTSQLSILSAYSRNGAYNMLNYYTVGAMMNFNI